MLRGASTIEEVICLSNLIATKTIPSYSTIEDMRKYFEEIHTDCDGCLLKDRCVACMINE